MNKAIAAAATLVLVGACAHRPAATPLGTADHMSPIVRFEAGKDVPAILRQHAVPVRPDDPALPALIDSLRRELESQGGVGLAAPQVGVSRRVVLVKRNTRPQGEIRVDAWINPVIESASPETDLDWEACLSVDGGGGLVRRHQRIVVTHEPLGGGERLRLELSDWDARIAQHEIDHLDGVLFIDHLEGPLVSIDEMRKRRDEGHRQKGWLPPVPNT
jgi:peptide deformylase